jgi:ribonuclease HI
LLDYIEKLKLNDPEVSQKKGQLIQITREKEKFYSINIMDIMKFKIDQKIITSIRNIVFSNNTLKNVSEIKIFFDGGCANKERLGFFGCSFYFNDHSLFQIAGNIGPNNTNNTSEYFGLIILLIFLDLLKIKDFNIGIVKIFTDSELVCRQVQGKYKINTPHIIILNSIVMALQKKIHISNNTGIRINITHVLREFNEEADKLANIGKTFENNCFVVNY